jgi:oligopeptide transport system substrate-binding protein
MTSDAPARKPLARFARLAMPAIFAAGVLAAPPAATAQSERAGGARVLQLPIRTDGPKSLDPVKGSTTYDNQACGQVYETLLQWKYLVRPLTLEPLLLEEMPKDTLNPDGTQTWQFKLKQGVRFQDDECFPGGKGREVVADDVFYSWKRLADPEYKLENWWLLDGAIVGLNEFKEAQGKAAAGGLKFDYDAPVEGFKKISDQEFEVVLTKPVFRFMYVLTQFQTSIVPREAVEHYRGEFTTRPVGTGPFMVKAGDWRPGEKLIFTRNPTYRRDLYPSELPADPELAARDVALGFQVDAGKPLPLVDRIEVSFYVPDPSMWLDFQSGKIGYTQVPAEYFDQAFVLRTEKIRPEWAAKGIVDHAVPLLDFIFRGFNMEDPVVGGYTEEKRALRQAISLAIDLDEMNEKFYNGLNKVYDGPIPPGLDGHPDDGEAPVSYRGPDIGYAKELLAKAGYPGGKDKSGNQLVIDYYTSLGGNNPEQTAAEQRMLEEIGVKLNARLVNFSELIEAVNEKKAQLFGFAWGSDYPDGENNLALFYSKNKAPGSNHYNYDRPDYDKMYESILTMKPGPERTAVYEKMRDMIIEDCPYVGSQARTRYYLVNPWLKNFKPVEDFHNYYKYLNVDDSKR